MFPLLDRAFRSIKDRLFPIFCIGCEREGEWWCKQCQLASDSRVVLACPVCGKSTVRGEVCKMCKAVSHLDGVTALFNYDEASPIGKLIKLYKYQRARDMRELWREIILDSLLDIPVPSAVMPVPLYPRRERERGFNQAEELALFVSEKYNEGTIMPSTLHRFRHTSQQATLNKSEREANVVGAFNWNSSAPAPARVLLVDDVFTTGSTMQECARVLKEHGAKEVWGFVLARG